MRWQFGFVYLRGNGRRYDGRTEPVASIVLNDKHRAHAALLAPDNGAQVGIIYVASFDVRIHKVHTPPEESLRAFAPPVSFSHATAEFILCKRIKFRMSPPRISYAGGGPSVFSPFSL
ncbi:hypothetical protein SDC9_209739 [bioreactor metagenome]|uniref:Uncharacterized protein n=1 Tax=bioreactor metagenome TaxID=1076179 RepID=A0A645JR82_9ZZZZ